MGGFNLLSRSAWLSMFIVAVCCVAPTQCVYFIMGEKETKCLIDDFLEDSTTTFQYNATADAGQPIGLKITVYDPLGSVMLSKEYGTQSTVSFTSHESGDHAICASTNSTMWGIYATGTMRVEFTLKSQEGKPRGYDEEIEEDERDRHHGDEVEEEEEEEDARQQKDKKLAMLENRIEDLLDSVFRVIRSQRQFRRIDSQFRIMAETVNTRVVVWGFIQFCILLAAGSWQMHSLRSFFIRKKLV